jgi:anti-sigma factor RsiW
MPDHNMHEQIKEKLFAFYDGELPETERREVAAHLEVCPACRDEQRRWSAAAALFFRPSQPQASEAFVRRVMTRVEAEAHPSPFSGLFAWRWLAPAMGAGLAALALTLFVPRDDAPISTETLLLANAVENGDVAQELPSADEMFGDTLEQPKEIQ